MKSFDQIAFRKFKGQQFVCFIGEACRLISAGFVHDGGGRGWTLFNIRLYLHTVKNRYSDNYSMLSVHSIIVVALW